jgi:hypothetical protein
MRIRLSNEPTMRVFAVECFSCPNMMRRIRSSQYCQSRWWMKWLRETPPAPGRMK